MEHQKPPFGFQISRILDCGFMIEENVNYDVDLTDIGYGMNFVFDVENSWIRFAIRTDFRTKDTSQVFISGTVLTDFAVDNLKVFLDNQNIVNFPAGSLEMLFGIAFSHMRAIVAKNVSGSKFNNVLIPVINPSELFPELIRINIETFSEYKKQMGIKDNVTVSDFRLRHKVTA